MKDQVRSRVKDILRALHDKKAVDVLVLDVRHVVSYTDFMVLCSGTSSTHVGTLVSSAEDALKPKERPVYKNSSKDNSWWILDFVDIVVHVFKEDARVFYNLEEFWGDAKTLKRDSLEP